MARILAKSIKAVEKCSNMSLSILTVSYCVPKLLAIA